MKQLNSIFNTTEKTYQSIEFLPIWNWYEILKTGDLKHLFISGKGRVNENIGLLWDSLQDEYIEVFGLDEKFIKRINLLKQKAILNYEFILTKDRFINTKLSILDADLDELNSGEAIGFYSLKDHLEKYKGFRIDPKETTVIEWHTALKNMSNG